jgi:hypothetical protein
MMSGNLFQFDEYQQQEQQQSMNIDTATVSGKSISSSFVLKSKLNILFNFRYQRLFNM